MSSETTSDRSDIAAAYYSDGSDAYRMENYEDAVPNLEKAFKYDPSNEDALFDLANAYYRLGEEDQARNAFLQVMELFPDTEKAGRAEDILTEMGGQD